MHRGGPPRDEMLRLRALHIAGLELAFQQHFTYLPGFLNGLGVSANYSSATSQARNVNPDLRSDSPALLRQAPNTLLPSASKGPSATCTYTRTSRLMPRAAST